MAITAGLTVTVTDNTPRKKVVLSSHESARRKSIDNYDAMMEARLNKKRGTIKVGQIWHMKKYTNSKQYHRTLKILTAGYWLVNVYTPNSKPYILAVETLLHNYRPAPQQRTKPTAK